MKTSKKITAISMILGCSLVLVSPSYAKGGAGSQKISGPAKDLSVQNDYQAHARMPHSLRKQAAKRLRNAHFKAREQKNLDAKARKGKGGKK